MRWKLFFLVPLLFGITLNANATKNRENASIRKPCCEWKVKNSISPDSGEQSPHLLSIPSECAETEMFDAEAEEDKPDEEKAVEKYMDHGMSGECHTGFTKSMCREYRVKLEKQYRVQYGSEWESHYWNSLISDMDAHYRGSLSKLQRARLRADCEARYGVNWRRYYWRRLAQDMEFYQDAETIRGLRNQYGRRWRIHYAPYACGFGARVPAKVDSSQIRCSHVIDSSCEKKGRGVFNVEAEEDKPEEERAVELYMDHEVNGECHAGFTQSMCSAYRVKLEKQYRAQYGREWENHFWDSLASDVDMHYQGTMSKEECAKLKANFENTYGVDWRRFYWRKLVQDMEFSHDSETISRLRKQYGKRWRMHYGPYARGIACSLSCHRPPCRGCSQFSPV